nr:hypothetical protein [Tanacetum cinerariifolium]
PIPRTPEGSENEGNDEEDQDLRLSEEARIQEEEEADELYRDVDINQGWGLQVSQDIEDSHVTLTPIHPDGLQESSSVSSFVTSMLNPISDADRGSKRQREGREHASADTPSKPATRDEGIRGNLQHQIVIGTRPCQLFKEVLIHG